ncbi:MAG: sugar phosphate isomerase/epimerase [Deltaproteobacteria bacterium]|nr:sugar phosphate isomerase/epimerase [Deltaproteobacteria bacterium]
MRFGICVYIEDVGAAERAGYDYVELTVTNVIPAVGEADFQMLKKKLRSYSIQPEAWRRFLPSTVPVVGKAVNSAILTEYVKTTLDRISDLGGKVVVFGSPAARNIPEGFSTDKAHDQLIRFLHMTADVAAANDIIVVIEPIIRKNCNVINLVSEAVVLAHEINRPEIKTLADLYHMTGNDEPVNAITEASKDLYHVHMPVPDIAGLGEARSITTAMPAYRIQEFLERLWRANYAHRVSVEDLDRRFMNLEREAPLVLSHIREIWQGVSM